MKISVAVDASRARSGGARAHLIGILSEMADSLSFVETVHLWAYRELLDSIPDEPWLVKHCPVALEHGLFSQIYWQRFRFHEEVAIAGCDITLNVDAATFSKASPCVTMSRDMLSFEPGEIERFGFSIQRLRLHVLRGLQVRSLRKANGVVFLTEHARRVISRHTGRLENVAMIPHGIGDAFRAGDVDRARAGQSSSDLRGLYVSPIWLFKHQDKVVEAVSLLRARGLELKIWFAGGEEKAALKIFNKAVDVFDPRRQFTKRLGFVQHQDLPSLLSRSDFFVFASSCENMPNSLIEAMSMGMPIACSNRGPMPEVLRDGGLYFDPEDVCSIADSIEEIVNDPALREKLSQKALSYSAQYSWKRCSNETFLFLKETLFKSRMQVGKDD